MKIKLPVHTKGNEIPGKEVVAETLRSLGGHANAMELSMALEYEGYRKDWAQLGMQRATDPGGSIRMLRDFTLKVRKP